MAKQQKTKTPRNWLAVQTHFRSGAGKHTDRKKAASKKACRGKVTY